MDTATLPNNINDLKKIIISLTNDLQKASGEIETLEFQLAKALQARFGRSSEKQDPKQLLLFDEASVEDAAVNLDEADENITVVSYTKTKRGRKPLPKELPREVIVHDLSDADKICSCGTMLKKIGEDKYEQLEYIPATIKVLEHIKCKYTCTKCENGVKTATTPKQPIPKSIATPGLLAQTLVSKFCDHLPLYRQEKIWNRYGVDIPRCTLSNWVIKCGTLLQPLVSAMRDYLVQQKYVQADETPVQVLNEKGKPTTSKSYIWVYRTGPPAKEIIIYEYQPGRGGEHVERFLADFSGYLQTDGFAGYNGIMTREDIIYVACMAHARRKFIDIVKVSKKSGKAQTAIDFMRKLYKIEGQIKGKSAHEKRVIRQKKSKPIMKRLKEFLIATAPNCPPKGPLGTAINYTLSRWAALEEYLTDGNLSIDNNLIENKIRPFAIGRRNWLFMNNVSGANAACNIYSLIETAKANDLEPYSYLRFILQKIPYAVTQKHISTLLPFNINKQYIDNNNSGCCL